MKRALLRRLVSLVPVFLGTVLVTMLALQVIPGDPAELLLGQGATPETVSRLRSQFHLDRPFLVRYADYVTEVARGDLGRSIVDGRPVLQTLGTAWLATAQLGGAALVLTVLAGVLIGVGTAVTRNSLVDHAVRAVSLVGLSMPVFWTGAVLVLVLSFWLGLFPSGGRGSFGHLVLPAVTLAIPSIATVSRITRASVLEVLGEGYIRTARAKGVSEGWILFRHALQNTVVPIVTVLGVQLGQLLGGAALTETVFAWPGLGRVVVQSVLSRDYPVLQAGILLLALTFVLTNLLVDLLYLAADPRISHA